MTLSILVEEILFNNSLEKGVGGLRSTALVSIY